MSRIKVLVFVVTMFLATAVCTMGQESKQPKLNAEHVISKHLESIGSPQAVAAAKSRVFVGTTELHSKLVAIPEQQRTGQCQIAFHGDMYLYAAVFPIVNYPYEKIAYDGRDFTFGNSQYGKAVLSDFLLANKFISKRGLLGGALNSAWLLTNVGKGVSFDYDGQTKETRYHKIKAVLSDSAGTIVTLFFEPIDFRHVRTEYRWSSSGLMTRSPSASTAGPTTLSSERGAQPSHQILIEEFSKFAKAGELVLPLVYRIELSSSSNIWSWTNTIKDVYYNEALEPSVFKVS